MKAAAAVAEILNPEGVEFLIGYPNNPIYTSVEEYCRTSSSTASGVGSINRSTCFSGI